tara:strand:+ start:2360 stop:3055 length:696 start_codon:yes stop_codon:yes gene_type:complete
MGISLAKGQKIDLKKSSGEKLDKFCVEVSWGAIEKIVNVKEGGFLGFGGTIVKRKKNIDVDLDLGSIIVDENGKWIDHVYSPEYNGYLNKNNLPLGRLKSKDYSLIHSGDDLGQGGGNDFKEVISVDLSKVSSQADKIFFFLNIYLNEGQTFDFSDIPFAKIKMYEGTPSRITKEFSTFDVVTDSDFNGKRALIMGKLYKKNGLWKFDAIGDATDDQIFTQTIGKILKEYV